MDVRIGVTYSPKEIDLELPADADRAAVRAQVEEALAGGTGVLWLEDARGRVVGIPADKVAYVEIGAGDRERRYGFGT